MKTVEAVQRLRQTIRRQHKALPTENRGAAGHIFRLMIDPEITLNSPVRAVGLWISDAGTGTSGIVRLKSCRYCRAVDC